MANTITALGLVKLFEDFTNNRNIKLVGTTTVDGSTVAWESTSEPVNFGVQSQAGQATVATLIDDVVFEITYPSGTTSIDFDEVHLVNRNDSNVIYLIADIDGGSVQYTGFGEFTVTDFDIDFSPTPTQ
jgi:autotransporter translocation and assembly factor TamB